MKQNRPIYLILAVIIVLLYLLSSHKSEGPVMGAQKECPPTGNQIVLNEAHVGKGEQLRAGKPRKEDDIEEDRHSVSREEFRGLNGLEKKYNLIIVGAGLSGSVIAERASKMLGLKSLVIDKREHIGGNCYDYIDEHGIRTSMYGVHIFHTKYDRVKEYVSQFSEWIPYEHRVVAKAKDVKGNTKFVPMPPNIQTVNMLFGTDITKKEEMVAWLNKRRPSAESKPKNGEDMAISRVGKDLYKMLIKPYTKKQWDKFPAQLDAEVFTRLPYREDNDDRYFNDPWQNLPKDGYTAMFENILLKDQKITVRLGMDYFKIKDNLPEHDLLVFTGPIDAYFASKGLPKLEYRSIYWEKEYMEPTAKFFQPAWVVNYPEADVNWTRVSEYKHAPNQPAGVKEHPGTVVYREYSTDVGDPYYPVPNKRNKDLYAKYQALAQQAKGVKFVGRLASYKYFNMDQAILNALEFFDSDIKNLNWSGGSE